MNTLRKKDGTFEKQLHEWTPEYWNDGWIIKGRFMVYRPDYPKTYKGGYALRAHVVYWLNTGDVPTHGMELHHKNEIKTDDRFENLVLLTHSEHQTEHKANWITIICAHCGKEFKEHAWRVAQRNVKFCSQACYQAKPRTTEHRPNFSKGAKIA